MPSQQERRGRRGEIVVLLAVPAMLLAAALLGFEQAALLTLLVVLAALALFFVRFETSAPGLRQIMPTVVLAALAAAGRILFAPLPNAKPVSAIAIVAGVVFGRHSGFMVGALAALVSNFFFGQGPWTPWQMYAWGLIGYLAGLLADHRLIGQKRPLVLYVYGFLSAMLYGLLLNGWYVVGYVQPITLPSVLLAFTAGFPFDLAHGIATVIFLLIFYQPWHRKLERIKTKYDL